MAGSVNFIETLTYYKKAVEAGLTKYLDEKKAASKSFGNLTDEVYDLLKDYTLRGGKRFRAALLISVYRGISGDTTDTAIIKPAMGLELMHVSLLAHDDIMDESVIRRGKPTPHIWVQNWYLKNVANSPAAAKKFGETMAIIIGDLYNAFGIQCITDSDFPPEKKLEALRIYNTTYERTGKGQMLDVWFESKGDVTEEEYGEMIFRKTTTYTGRCPVEMGCVLGGARPEQRQALIDYITPAIQAFQMQDDIIDCFSTPEKTGKTYGADIKEGKRTLMVVKALAAASPAQRAQLLGVLGKRDASDAEIERAKAILVETGAVGHVKAEAARLAQKAKDYLVEAEVPAETKDFLMGFADYMITRDY